MQSVVDDVLISIIFEMVMDHVQVLEHISYRTQLLLDLSTAI